MQPTKTEAIKRLLEAKTYPDLAALYNSGMETQVLVGQNGGHRIEGEYRGKYWVGFQNPETGEQWKSFRIPYSASKDPFYDDGPMNYDLEKYFDGVGLSGWDWKNRQSIYVGFDFDAIVGHSDKHEKKLTETELEEIKQAIFNVPWTTLRRSTSGKGLHLYIFLEDAPTENHNEHAALARAVLGLLSSITGFDFKSKVDVCGHILWILHRKMEGTNGLELLKQGETLKELPINWKDHLSVVSGKRKKTLPSFIEEKNDSDLSDNFEELCGQRNIIKLDPTHKRLLEWIRENGYSSYWDSDHNMIVTHTYFLAKAFDELGMKGVFKTISAGTEAPNDQNCFAYPMRKGSWVVRRYSKGVAEADSWHQDANGWTRCFYNREPDFYTACRTFGGQEDDKGRFVFEEAEVALQAARMLGAPFEIPPWAVTRRTYLRKSKEGKLIIEIEKADVDNGQDMKRTGFLVEKKSYLKVFSGVNVLAPSEPEIHNFDDMVRHIVSEDGHNVGWLIKSEEKWVVEPLENTKLALEAMGEDNGSVRKILGSHIFKHWTLVNRPFEPEYPGDRRWNRDSAQFLYAPNLGDRRSFSTWTSILNHCGLGLDEALASNDWAKANGVLKGGDYLKIWIASLFQMPLMQLPYLFFYGEQGVGKSLFYEALEAIITPNGVKEANNALQSTGNFNGEIAQAVICYVNEVNLSRGRGRNIDAYNKIKNWVTALRLTVHPKGKDPYMIPNTSHWIQVANDPSFCPIFPGDTRITMIRVPKLDRVIAKSELLSRLKKEASDFIGEMLTIDLPAIDNRYGLPVIETEEKLIAQAANMTPLERFLYENVFQIDGKQILFSDFKERFLEYLSPEEKMEWTAPRISKALASTQYPTGRSRQNNSVNIINASWDQNDIPGRKLVLKEGKIS
jgi:hypothetical protein